MSTAFVEWPGKSGGSVTMPEGQEARLEAKTKGSESLKWYRGDDEVGVIADPSAAGEDAEYTLSDDRRTLTVAKVDKEKDEGPWAVVANTGQSTEERKGFTVEVKPAVVDESDEPDPTPSEWDPDWAGKVGIAALLIALAAGIGLGATVYFVGNAPETWHVERIPTVVTLVLLGAGLLALVLAAALAAIEVRGRARARPAAVVAVADAARSGALVAPILKEIPELLKSFGGLKETAALAITSLALFGGAVGLAWAKFPDQGEAPVKAAAIAIEIADRAASATGCRITVRVEGKTTRRVKAGDATIEFNDTSKLCGATLGGAGTTFASGWRHIGKTTTTTKLKPIDYDLTLLLAKKGNTPTPKRIPSGTLTATA